jgi:hypothetical protein
MKKLMYCLESKLTDVSAKSDAYVHADLTAAQFSQNLWENKTVSSLSVSSK